MADSAILTVCAPGGMAFSYSEQFICNLPSLFSLGVVYSLENKFVVSGPENGRLFIKNKN
jgi:hypothetical protein